MDTGDLYSGQAVTNAGNCSTGSLLDAYTAIPRAMLAMREIDAAYPKKNRLVRVEMSPKAKYDLDNHPSVAGSVRHQVMPDAFGLASHFGVPIDARHDLAWGSYLMHMADRSSVMVYPRGLKVRCLSDEK